MSLAAFLAVVFVHLLAAMSPGPAVLMAARTGITQGFRTGAAMAAGLGIGALTWACAALFGLAALFHFAPGLLLAFKLAGAAYLIFLAVMMWRHADEPLSDGTDTPARLGQFQAFRLGLTTQLANPKPAIFFGAVFAGMVPQGTPLPVLALLLVAVFLNEFLWNIVIARVFSLARMRAAYLGLKATIDRVFGSFLALLGVKIAAS